MTSSLQDVSIVSHLMTCFKLNLLSWEGNTAVYTIMSLSAWNIVHYCTTVVQLLQPGFCTNAHILHLLIYL